MTLPGDPPHGFDAFADPVDPFSALIDSGHRAAPHARAAADLLDVGDARGALDAVALVRAAGVPAELVPHLALVEGLALLLDGSLDDAQRVLGDAWREHPDVAALPAALGAAWLIGADAARAAHAMYAALVSDDPDRSLAIHRRRLTLLLGAVRDAE